MLLTIAIVTTTLLSGGLAEIEFLPGQDFPLAAILQALRGENRFLIPTIPIPINIVRLVLACVWLLFILSVIAFILSPEFRREALKRLMRYLLLFLFIYGLMQVLQDNILSSGEVVEDSAVSGQLEPAPAEMLPTPPDFVVNPPAWFVTVITIILASLLLLIAWLIWRYFVRLNSNEPTAPLERLAQEALKGLQAGGDLKDIIMHCYFEMSQVLNKEHGLRRQQAMTPQEFEHYLVKSGLDSHYIRRLTRLFEGVRYGRKPPGPQEEQEAIACLTAIIQTYGRS